MAYRGKTAVIMAHSMDKTVVAEGVEESEQYDLLNEYSCDQIQGYLLSKPVPSEELLVMLKNDGDSANESPIKLVKS